MSIPLKKQSYTYEDYCTWDDDKRWELIDGIAYAMSPAPSLRHQGISMNLSRIFSNYLIGKKCKVYASPIDVILNPKDKADTVVQPDLIIVCDSSKLDGKKACKGAPDMVVEILSPSTSKKDRIKKLKKYKDAGVREYWIIDPEATSIEVLILRYSETTDIFYSINVYDENEMIPVSIFDDLEISFNEIFAE